MNHDLCFMCIVRSLPKLFIFCEDCQWRIQTFTDGGANRKLGLSMLCLGISYCGKPIRVRPHRFTGHGIIEEKTFSVIKGKVWLPQANFFRDVIGVKMGMGLNKMQINSIVMCINFIDNSIHVCSLSAQPPHTSLIVNTTTATRKTVWALKFIWTLHTCSIWYTTHIHCTCIFSAIFRTMETSKSPSTLQVKLPRFSLIK